MATYNTKYSRGDEVYVMYDNRVCRTKIRRISIEDGLSSKVCTQYYFDNRDIPCKQENEIFLLKEELLKTL